MTGDIIFASIVGFLIGTLFYYYDRKSGKKLYKKWYDVSNKNELDIKANVGFVDGRLFGQKLTVAIVIAIVCYGISFLIGQINPLAGLLYAGGLFVGVLASFYLSGKLFDVFSKKSGKTIDIIESFEKGERNLKEELKDIIPSPKEIRDRILPEKEEEKPVEDEKPKESPKEKKDDWRDGVDTFLKK